jgi:hypothetical protein
MARSISGVLGRVEALTLPAEAVAPNDSPLAALALEDAEKAARDARVFESARELFGLRGVIDRKLSPPADPQGRRHRMPNPSTGQQ